MTWRLRILHHRRAPLAARLKDRIMWGIPPEYAQQIEACAALLLAAILIRQLSESARSLFVVAMFSVGALAGLAGLANNAMRAMFS